jgi:hypothetical protein
MSACLASVLFAQSSEPRLAGTWVIDDDHLQSRGNQTWAISISENEIIIDMIFHTTPGHVSLILFADKRGETNVSATGKRTESKTYWKDKKLIREYTYKVGDRPANPMSGPQYATARVTETYYLSKDGNKLTVRRDDDSIWPNRNTPVKMGRAFEDKIILRRKS